ncbi:MAG: NAD-binding protein [Deltaproteobacteria bacterium]|nr:NAD-binding protein [Deltaproteobacteria bacterium]
MPRPPRPLRQRVHVQLRYLWALLKRFRVTFLLLATVQIAGSLIFWLGYTRNGAGISLAQAMGNTYFLMLGQPALEMPDSWWLVLTEAVIPVLGIAVLADGLVRFGFLFFAKHRNDKEWIAVQALTLKNHVVLCGAGRIGYRVLGRLQKLGMDVVVVERNENAPFAAAIRDEGVPLLIDDLRSHNALEVTNIRAARAIVCATDDDLANLNIALDARRFNPKIRVVMRLFDDDLVRKVEDAFQVEAFSTSSLAAPAFAAAALDSCIRTSFDIGDQMVVVGEVRVVGPPLLELTVARAQDEVGIRVLRIKRGETSFDPKSTEKLREGDLALIQAPFELFEKVVPSGEEGKAGCG